MVEINLEAQALIPHRKGMCLVDRALCGNEEQMVAEATVKPDGLFIHNGEMGAWVLLEYMAQCVSLWACWQAKMLGKPMPVGFLLGTRHLKLHQPFIAVGTQLRLVSRMVYVSEEGLTQFDCESYIGDELVATAKVNAYQPPNLEEFLKDKFSVGQINAK